MSSLQRAATANRYTAEDFTAQTSSPNALDNTLTGLLQDGTDIIQEGNEMLGLDFDDEQADSELLLLEDENMGDELRRKREKESPEEKLRRTPRQATKKKRG